ncbi:MAG: zf-HC2 domain-containing protein, partial [Candidatus Binatia bacterium]
MACDERRVVAYLAGGLEAEARAAFERHLLDCEECWSSVRDDRRGRQLAERLRSLAPAGLSDRVRAAVELQA